MTPQKDEKSPHWHAEQLGDMLRAAYSEEDEKLADQLIKDRRVLDFSILNGKIRAKVSPGEMRPVLVEIETEQLEDEQWDRVFSTLASNALLLAKLLVGKIPNKANTAFIDAGTPLVPNSLDEFRFLVDGKEEKINGLILSVFKTFLLRAEEDSFVFFLLRGRGRDETILELRRYRGRLKPFEISNSQDKDFSQEKPVEIFPSPIEDFWSAPKELLSLSYTIKADELPAAILKRLDPLPLRGLEDDVDFLLETAYVHIANRAQGYGLGLE